MSEDEDTEESTVVDPVEFLKRALAISPEDAAKVREEAAKRGSKDVEEHAGDEPLAP